MTMSLPLENLDNKSFEELVAEAKKRIPIHAPGWTDFNLHDPGITLIELFAWLAEMQIYRLNRVTDDSYRNFLKLAGITDSEDLVAAITEARRGMKTVSRGVTSEDYEALALATPEIEVARVKAIPRYHPGQYQEVPGQVTVVVVPAAENPDPAILDSIYHHLERHRLLTSRLFVSLPHYTVVGVTAEVIIKPEYLETTVEGNVKERLHYFLHPLSGGGEGGGWPFGRPVYLSEIYETIDGVEGVDYVETGSLRLKKGDGDWQESHIAIPCHGLVCAGTLEITARELQPEPFQDFNDG